METVQTKDVLPVRSRVSWGAVFAGAVVALAVYLLLSMLGVALGLTLTSQNSVGERELNVGAAIWAIVTTLLALFLGGWVTSQCTVGENKSEAIIYGVLLWGVFFAVMLWMLGSGVRVGFNTVVGLANTPVARAVTERVTDEDLRAWGLDNEQIAKARRNMADRMKEVAEDPRMAAAAWWALGGIFLSMIAAICGAVLGAGPNLWLAGVRVRTTNVDTGTAAR
jgi:hypothetical protein